MRKGAGRIRGSDFGMRYEWGIGAPSFDTLELRGTVSTGANGGSLVLARSGRNSGLAGSIATLLVISVLLWFRGSKGWGAPLFLALVYPLPLWIFGVRGTSPVPSQALMMLNNEFVLQQAARWAMQNQSIEAMFQQAYSRRPEKWELDECQAFLDSGGFSG